MTQPVNFKRLAHLFGNVCVCMLVLLGFNTATHAATVSFQVGGSASDNFTFMGAGEGTVGLSITMDLQQFDPALGTLTGVDLTLEYLTQSVSSTVTNTSVDTAVDLSIGPSRVSSFSAPGVSVGRGDGPESLYNLGPLQSISAGLPGLFSSLQNTYSASELAPYIGTSTVAAVFSHSGSVQIGFCSPNCLFLETVGSHDATVQTTITYTFDEASVVPVPAAVWLFSSGLLGLVGIARRKKT